jgi:hypothetical protein
VSFRKDANHCNRHCTHPFRAYKYPNDSINKAFIPFNLCLLLQSASQPSARSPRSDAVQANACAETPCWIVTRWKSPTISKLTPKRSPLETGRRLHRHPYMDSPPMWDGIYIKSTPTCTLKSLKLSKRQRGKAILH